MKKYEIINPSDKCFIYAEDVRLAKIACIFLGQGWYGLLDENGEQVLGVFETFGSAIGIEEAKVGSFIAENMKALAEVFRSFEYADEQTSLNNIGERAKNYAVQLEKKMEETPKAERCCETCKHEKRPGKPCEAEEYDCMDCDWDECICTRCRDGSKWERREENAV